MDKKYNIWLSYVSFPIAPAIYIERALKQDFEVVTCGPNTPSDIFKNWHIEELEPLLKSLNFSFDTFTPDIKNVIESSQKPLPDLFLWVETLAGYFPLNIEKLDCPSACYLIDSHLNLNWHVRWAKFFDYVFVAQKEYIPAFKQVGCKNVYWLPLACDPGFHTADSLEKKYDVGFVGSLVDTRRIELTNKIKSQIKNYHYEKAYLKDMANVFGASKIVFNNAIKNDLNMRFFETMASGSLLLSDYTNGNGQEEMFIDRQDFVGYNDDNLLEKINYYLVHEEEREQIAKRGHNIVLAAHTYKHRTDEIIKVCLENQNNTPSASEWRQRSISALKI